MERKILDNKDLGYLSFISCNHDMPRPNRFLNEKELRMFYMILFTLPGVPFLYYGDEIEMIYHENLPSKECGYGRTGSRTPMVFDDSKNKGFSNADEKDLFLPIDKTTSVISKENDKNSIYHLIKDLIKLRKDDENLQGNNIEFVSCDNRLLVYKRNDDLVIINPSKETKTLNVNSTKIIYADGQVSLNNNELVLENQYIKFDDLLEIATKLNAPHVFISNDKLIEQQIEYNPDILEIVNYSKFKEEINPHAVNPIYLKKTEAEETKGINVE